MNSMNMPKRLWMGLAAFASVGLLAAGLLFATHAAAAPGVSWKPSSITDAVSPGTAQPIPISFTASANLTNVVLRVVPALQGLVQVTPSTVATVQKGQTIHLTLTVAAPASAPLAVTQGTIHVVIGSATIAQPLPVQIIVASNAAGLLPPDPGAAGMATLAGIDSDNDGVRDDIQRYIWLTYAGSEKTRAGLFQEAEVFQDLLVAGTNKDQAAALEAFKQDDLGSACLIYILGLDQEIRVAQTLLALTLNTRARSLAYLDYNDLLRGEVLRGSPSTKRKAACDFDPDIMRN